jgi:uncharacterized secreted protein with C-terminal beta-propeller domain
MSAIKLDMYNVAKGSAKCETTLTLSETIESPALYNSKELLMDSDRNIIGFPAVDFVGNDNEYKVEGYYNLFSYKKGAFHLLKKITIEEDVVYETRGLYINNYLYIVTPKQIQAVNMKNYKVMGKISIK